MDKKGFKKPGKRVPTKLYRYFSLGAGNKAWFERIQDILEKSRLYCPAPSQLNDPFDCIVKLAPVNGEREIDFQGRTDREAGIQGRIDRQAGVLSFSKRKDNVPLWSHYANHHRGLCLEFNIKEWTKDKVQYHHHLDKVQYSISRQFVTLSPEEQSTTETLKKIVFTKHNNWRYENEWRMIRSFPNRCAPYLEFPKPALTGVIFGLRIADNDRCAVEQIIRDTDYPKLILYESREDHARFSVNIVPVYLTKT